MLYKEKFNFESKMRAENKTLTSEQNIHVIGLSYICNFLDRAGFAIQEVNTEPNHHFQLLAEISDKSLLIAVRTAYAPEVGTIDTSTIQKLVRESEELNAIPHFAGLTAAQEKTNDIEVEGKTEGQKFKIIFNGISAVRKSEVLIANS